MQVRGHERGSGTLQAAAAGAIVRADAVVDRALLGRMPNLRVLARTGVGVDLVDVAAATERGIAVVITPGSGTNAVAEAVIGMALHLAKRFGPLTSLVRGGGWAQRHQVDVGDLEGSTIGIVGYGRIGQRVGQLARAFGMRVLAYDPVTIPPDDVRCAALSDIATGSDVITLHAPLTEATRHLVNCRFLSVVKPGALLINCGRGALVDADAVLDALVAGRLAGVGLDVFEPEPPAHHPLFDHPDVVLTPDLMGLSRRATVATFADAARGVADVLAGRRPAALANPGWAPPADGRLADGETMQALLDGKIVLVSGGTAGVGAAVARAAAEGATVAITGRRPEPGEALAATLREGGIRAMFVRADVADVAQAQAQASAAKVIGAYGRIDCLVNSAGLTSRGSLLDTTPELFDQHIAVNLRAPFFLMQAVVTDMLARQSAGTIVNIISTSEHCGQAYLAPYTAAKAGLAGLTRNAAHAHRFDRIRINGLNIGWTATEGEDATQRAFHGAGDDWREQAAKSLPMGRLGQPDEIADFVVFLLSERSGVVTGSVIDWDQNVIGAVD